MCYRLQPDLTLRPRSSMYNTEPHVFNKLDHGTRPIALLTMTVTVDRKIVTGMIGRARTGNELLAVLDMIVESFTKPAVNSTPTLEVIEF